MILQLIERTTKGDAQNELDLTNGAIGRIFRAIPIYRLRNCSRLACQTWRTAPRGQRGGVDLMILERIYVRRQMGDHCVESGLDSALNVIDTCSRYGHA